MKSPDKHLFFRIMLSYLSILIVPAAIGSIIYFSSVSSMTKLVRDYSDSMLHQSIDIIDARLSEMESLPFYLESLPELIKLSGYDDIPVGGSGNYDIYNVYRQLPKFSLINSYIQNVQIILLNSGFVISENNALRLTPQTYSSLFSYTGMEYDAFWEFTKTQPFQNTFMQFENSSSAITPTVITSVGSIKSRYPWALVIIHLKESSLQDTMNQLLIDEGSIAFVLDENDNLVTSVRGKEAALSLEDARNCINTLNETETDYENYIVSTIQSDYNGWRYCIFSPREAVLSNMTDVTRSVILLITLCLIISVVFTVLLCMRKTDSLKKIASYLTGNSPELHTKNKKDEFSYILDAASGLMTSNRLMKQDLQSQKPLLDAAVLRSALFGATTKPEELQYLFSSLDIKPSNQKFCVILIVSSLRQDKASPELVKYPILFSALVREYIEKSVSCPTYCLDIDSRQKTVVLIGENITDEIFWQQIQLFVNRTCITAQKEPAITMNFYASDIYSMIDNLPKAYNQAVVISQHAAEKEGQLLFTARDIPEIQKLYYYPIQAELELIRLVRTGSQNELTAFLNTMKHTNFTERSLSSSMIHQLTFSVRSSILRGLADLPADQLSSEAFLEIQQAADLDALAESLLRLNEYLTHMNNQISSDKSKQLAEGILKYINLNYTCSNFTIYSLCEEFHISESFAYQIFREVIGTSFADLLEQIRIEKACQLLNQKTCLIKDIALSVGYTNDNSFRRAFKRVMGVSPGEFTSR